MTQQGMPGELGRDTGRGPGFWAAWIAITAAAYLFADVPVATAINGFSRNWLRPVYWIISSARDYGQGYCIGIVVTLIFVTERTRRRELARMVTGLALATLVLHLAKDICGRARPEAFLGGGEMWQFLGGFRVREYVSFPSGHAMSAFALSGALAAMYPKGRPVFFAAAAACGLTRILDNEHYISDVVAGSVLGWWIGSGAMRWRWTARIAERIFPAKAA